MAVLINRVPRPDKANRKKITFEDDGKVRFATVEYADDPIEPGNAVNKQNVIDTAKLMHEVGDIVSTMRADLDNKWLLTNGANFDSLAYPDLAALLGNKPDADWELHSSLSGLFKAVYGNGYWVGVNGTNTLYYTANTPNGIWLTKTMPEAVSNIAYGNGYWVVASATKIYYATDPTGTWTLNSGTTFSSAISKVVYGNGYWVVGTGNTAPNLYYRQTNPTSAFTAIAHDLYRVSDITYANGTWAAVGTASGGSVYRLDYIIGNPNVTWQTKTMGSGSNLTSNYIVYKDGYWILCGNNTSYYCTDLAGTWTELPAIKNTLSVANGYWFCYDGAKSLYNSGIPTDTWIEITDTTKPNRPVVYANDYYMSGILYKTYTLPTITNAAYNYIKVLPEGG